MPVHNAGDYLSAAVNSILEQQNVALELLIVDDHSNDGAIDALPKDPRIRLLRSPAKGLVPALNHGIKQINTPYVARMDGDDIADPRRLLTQLEYLLDRPEIDIVGAQVEMF